jgi:predicted DNA-binding protein (UPF0251 family)
MLDSTVTERQTLKHPADELTRRDRMLLRRNPSQFHDEQRALAEITDEEVEAYRLQQRQREIAQFAAARQERVSNFLAGLAVGGTAVALMVIAGAAVKAGW